MCNFFCPQKTKIILKNKHPCIINEIRLPLKIMREPGLTMVEEEELEPGNKETEAGGKSCEVGETEEISSAPVDSNEPGIEVPDTEDILGEEFLQEVLNAEFMNGEDVEKTSSNYLSQVRPSPTLKKKKLFSSLVCLECLPVANLIFLLKLGKLIIF